jgi:hypothetical protein
MPSTAAESIVPDLFGADSGDSERIGLASAFAETGIQSPALSAFSAGS